MAVVHADGTPFRGLPGGARLMNMPIQRTLMISNTVTSMRFAAFLLT